MEGLGGNLEATSGLVADEESRSRKKKPQKSHDEVIDMISKDNIVLCNTIHISRATDHGGSWGNSKRALEERKGNSHRKEEESNVEAGEGRGPQECGA